MDTLYRLNLGLGSLPIVTDAETRSISAENPDGVRGGGAHAVPGEKSAASMVGGTCVNAAFV